jgi:uncharacterized protein
MDRNMRTISLLDPYMPSGLMKSRSSALKSTFVIDAYDPGHIVLTKRSRESRAMMTLSTVVQNEPMRTTSYEGSLP